MTFLFNYIPYVICIRTYIIIYNIYYILYIPYVICIRTYIIYIIYIYIYIYIYIAKLESWLKNSARTPIYQCELL